MRSSRCYETRSERLCESSRPALQRRITQGGELIHTALGTLEPAVDVAPQDATCFGCDGTKVAWPARSVSQQHGTGQSLLAIRGHDRLARRTACEGSPLRLACSLSKRSRRRRSGRGRYGAGSASTSTRSRAAFTAISPKPSERHRRCTRGSRSRPRRVAGTANQTSSATRMRSIACNSRSRLKPSFISTIASLRFSSSRTATMSQPRTSPLTRKPAALQEALHRRIERRLGHAWQAAIRHRVAAMVGA